LTGILLIELRILGAPGEATGLPFAERPLLKGHVVDAPLGHDLAIVDDHRVSKKPWGSSSSEGRPAAR
jgi:hypothetical protein